MRLNSFLIGSALSLSACSRPAQLPPAKPHTGPVTSAKIETPKPAAQPSEDFVSEYQSLRIQDRELEKQFDSILQEFGWRARKCLRENKDLYNRGAQFFETMANEPAALSCPNNPKNVWMDCVYSVQEQKGNYGWLVTFFQLSVDIEKKVLACYNDQSRWDPALLPSDFEGVIMPTHPDPDIRQKMHAYADLEDAERRLRVRFQKRYGYQRGNLIASKLCLQTPEQKFCRIREDQKEAAFQDSGTKADYLIFLDQRNECQEKIVRCLDPNYQP